MLFLEANDVAFTTVSRTQLPENYAHMVDTNGAAPFIGFAIAQFLPVLHFLWLHYSGSRLIFCGRWDFHWLLGVLALLVRLLS